MLGLLGGGPGLDLKSGALVRAFRPRMGITHRGRGTTNDPSLIKLEPTFPWGLRPVGRAVVVRCPIRSVRDTE